ncbi:MAG: hypothetical protein PHS79_06015 [Patescibacteria group bacterium]|nr:hypothetical protein [Patescibacteria group bacterium]
MKLLASCKLAVLSGQFAACEFKPGLKTLKQEIEMQTKKPLALLVALFVVGAIIPQLETLRIRVSATWFVAVAMLLGVATVFAWRLWIEEVTFCAQENESQRADDDKHKWYWHAAVVVIGDVLLPLAIVVFGIGLGINFI